MAKKYEVRRTMYLTNIIVTVSEDNSATSGLVQSSFHFKQYFIAVYSSYGTHSVSQLCDVNLCLHVDMIKRMDWGSV